MNFIYIELNGAVWQPKDVLKLDDFWIVPASKQGATRVDTDMKLIAVFHKGADWQAKLRSFIFCYQFLFLPSDLYHLAPYPHDGTYKNGTGADINAIINELHKKYGSGGGHLLDFSNLDYFNTAIEAAVNFEAFYRKFSIKYSDNPRFKNFIDLFLYTAASKPKFYNNILQKIAQLQTIFEAIIGKPEQVGKECGFKHNKEDWKPFTERILRRIGVADEGTIAMITGLKTSLNQLVRVPYIHEADQMDMWDIRLSEFRTGTYPDNDSLCSKVDFEAILKKKKIAMSSADWDYLYGLYKQIIKRLIYIKFLNSPTEPSPSKVESGP